MAHNEFPDVLIVGAGPTGLMLAAELARQNIPLRIIDQKDGPSKIMKATALSSVAIEGFDDFNYSKPITDIANPTHALVIYAEGKRLIHAPWIGIESKYPYYCLIGQNLVEKLQVELLKQLGIEVEWQTQLIEYSDDEDIVEARIQNHTKQELLNSKFIIGCDGSHSVVRQQSNFLIHQKTYPSHYIIADVKLEGEFDDKDWYFFLAKNGFASIGALPNNRWGVLLTLPNNIEYDKNYQPTLSEVQSYFDELSDIPGKLSDPQWISHFHTNLTKTSNRRSNRVILCGDAAHQVSPLTSLGMNSGLMDARNLGWKLALVCKDHADDALLESYTLEQEQTITPARLLSEVNELSFNMTGPLSREYRDHMTDLMMHLQPLMKYFGGILSQSTISISKSPIIDEFIGLPLHWRQQSHFNENTSCLTAWATFGKGPHAGHRAPDVILSSDSNNNTVHWFFDRHLSGKHALMYFLANEHNQAMDLDEINSILQQTKEHYGQWIDVLVISYSKDNNLDYDDLIFDESGAVHRRYGAKTQCFYLIRPDRFVGFRCLPPRWDKLNHHLDSIFKHRSQSEGKVLKA